MAASARPSAFKQAGGGFLNGVDGVIVNNEFTTELPGGGSPKKGSDFTSLFNRLTVKVDGQDEEQTTHLFVGSADDFEIEDDGATITPVEESGGLRANTNFSLFINDLVAAGFPESSLPEDQINFAAINGTRCRFVQVIDEQMKKKGKKRTDKNGKEWDYTRLSVEKVYALPKGGGAAKSSGSNSGDAEKLAVQSLVALLKKAPGKALFKKKLPVAIINQVGAKHPLRTEVKDLVTSDEFLADRDEWSYDAETQEITLAA